MGIDFRGDVGVTSPSIFRTSAFVFPNKNMEVAEDFDKINYIFTIN